MNYAQVLPDVLQKAQQAADTIKGSRNQQRLTPFIGALQQQGQRYGAATNDQERQSANAMANTIRETFLSSGGVPGEMPENLWGGSPTQGFQVGADQFSAPVTGLEGLSFGQRREQMANQQALKRQAFLDALDQRKLEAGLTGVDPFTGQNTWDRQYQEGQLGLSREKLYTPSVSDLINKEKQNKEEALQLFMSTSELYKTGNDYLADVRRRRDSLIGMLGVDGYKDLENDALKMAKGDPGASSGGGSGLSEGDINSMVNGNFPAVNGGSIANPRKGTRFTPGGGSPIADVLGKINVNPNKPTSVSRGGIDRNVIDTVNRYAAQYNVDPALILAIGQHETGWGKLGDGRKGMYLGYGSYDSGSDYSKAGLDSQVRGVARKLNSWGMSRGNVTLDRLRQGNAGAFPSGIYATDKGWPEKVWKYYQQYGG